MPPHETSVFSRIGSAIAAIERAVWLALVVFLTPFVALAVFNSFVVHMTPDTARLLLDVRTFLETGNRFAASYGSKGLMLVFLVTPGALLFGPSMAGAAFSQLCAYGIVGIVLYRLARSEIGTWAAPILCLCWVIAAFSPLIWGGRVRAGDFGVAFAAIALWGAWKGRPLWLFAAGLAAAATAFTKTSLFLAPTAIACVGALSGPGDAVSATRLAEAVRREALPIAGFAIGTAFLLVWIVAFDDPYAWLEQTFLLPGRYTQALTGTALRLDEGSATLRLLLDAGLFPLFVGSVAGLAFGCFSGQQRLALLVATFLAAEIARIEVERTIWRYQLTGLLVPMILGCGFWGSKSARPRRIRFGWILAPALLAAVLKFTIVRHVEAFRFRMIERAPSPAELLAKRMEAVYAPGEAILAMGEHAEILLLLDAPKPSALLPHYFPYANAERRAAELAEYADHPPPWVVDSRPALSGTACYGFGSLDDLVFAQFGSVRRVRTEGRFHVGDRYAPRGEPGGLGEWLLGAYPYELAVDTGCFQAWRLPEVSSGADLPALPRGW